MSLYAVIRTRGSAWQKALALEAQVGWETHASFMDSLVSGGFVVLGGPLEGTDEVLLIVHASSPEQIADRLRQDPWSASGLRMTLPDAQTRAAMLATGMERGMEASYVRLEEML